MPKLSSGKFSKKDQKKLTNEKHRLATVPDNDDLYKALHWVNDDFVKAEIEENLRAALDDDAFRTVVAIFNLSTGWTNPHQRNSDSDLTPPRGLPQKDRANKTTRRSTTPINPAQGSATGN